MKRQIYIALTTALLLISGSMSNSVWADVTYHVLTLPFTTYGSTANTKFRENVRVEAIKCTSSESTVGLPSAFQTPLMNSSAYKYYRTVTAPVHETLYGSNNTYYDVYESSPCSDELTAGSTIPEGVTDIYVIYEYDDAAKTGASLSLDLSGGTMYNITMKNGNTTYFYGGHYKGSWGNRTECVATSNYTAEYYEYLTSNDFTKTSKDSYGRNIGWFLKGNDPYNIRLVTGYTGDKKADNRCPIKDAFVWAQVNPNEGTSQSMWLFTDTLTNYRNMQNLFVSFLLLNHNNGEDYTMIGSNLNSTWGANGRAVVHPYNNKYFHLQYQDKDTGPRILPVTPANATPLQFYKVRDYTFNVTTPFYNSSGTAEQKAAHTVTATKKWSDLVLSASMTTDDVPDSLRRKYTSFDNLYTDDAKTAAISTYQDAYDNDCKVYVTYHKGTLPFDVLDVGGSYSDATWYELTDGNDNDKDQKIRWNSSSSIFQNSASDYAKVNEFAFIGDPYELQVIHRTNSESNTANRYVGAASEGNMGVSASADDGYVWEIPYDAVSGSFMLRQYKTLNSTPEYWYWNTSASGNTVTKSSSDSTRIQVVELPTYNYTYNVVDLSGRIAIKATTAQTIFTAPALPSIIYSPFLYGETVGYYTGSYTDGSGRGNFSSLTNITEVPATDNTNIWVKYTTSSLINKVAQLSQDQGFNVKLNGEYIYWDSETNSIKSNASPSDEDLSNEIYNWRLRGRDPYAMIIDNEGANAAAGISTTEENVTVYDTAGDGTSTTGSRSKGVWVQVEGGDWATGTLVFDETATRANATRFVAKASALSSGVYEVMAATGSSVDAATTYYNIGRTSDDGVKMFSNSAYMTGNNELAFILQRSDAKNVTYHLIDHSNTELLTVVNRHVSTDVPQFPVDYWSPLVKSYYYYASTADYNYNGTNKIKPHSTKDGHSELATVGENTDIYVTYETNDLVDLTANTMYLMEFTSGTSFYAENGADGVDTEETTAPFYPYCNGDNNFFVYGQDQYDLQQQGAASTRTRWAWYPQSENIDPYHVAIMSRQTSPYNGVDFHAYFHTYQPEGYDEVVTTLTWPGVSGVAATEYMVLGTEGQYQLVTTYGIDLNNDGDKEDDGESTRYVLNSFEQYWKTFDTIKKNIFKLTTVDESESSTVPLTTTMEIPSTSDYYNYKDSKNLREYLTDIRNFHSYTKWAYAKRWNGYNASGNKSKGWEEIEHWFQTVAVGSGYFNFVRTTIDPALILLDQHGWEIMRKPLPSGPDDPDKDEKYAAIRPYDSPMVKNYYFYTKTSKRSGCHQYYKLQNLVTVGGEAYTSSSLTKLPPYATASNIKDSNGNLLDQYVTYEAKEEYAYSYDPSTAVGDKFLIQQGGHYVSAGDGTTITKNNVPSGGMSAAIITAEASFADDYLWYLKPNTDIDNEMGYEALNPNWTNDYDSSTARAGFNSNGFDPYNIQISNAGSGKYFTTNADGANLAEGVMTGTYSGKAISLAPAATSYVTAEGQDHTRLQMTNQTFMAVQDENGNMQLMPRFDLANRMTDFDGLDEPQTNGADDETGTQSTLLHRPYIYNYIIVDNKGRESLRYQWAGEVTPKTPSHFQSPLATNFGYYKTLNQTDGVYDLESLADSVSSFAKLEMAETGVSGNNVYVRYEYDEDADVLGMLKGKWLTMQLNALDAQYSSGIKNGSKPATIDNDAKAWQWKFLRNNWTEGGDSYLAPDPYAVEIYNRTQKDLPMSATAYSNVTASAQALGDASYPYQRFALLSHTSGGYAMAVAGTGLSSSYYFLSGANMTTDAAASIAVESGFTSIENTFSGTNSQLFLNNDVENAYNYKVITNGGAYAVASMQSYDDAYGNNFAPVIPGDIQSPLLPTEKYLYYENATLDGSIYTVTDATKINTLYGLYEDYLYVRYDAYDRDNTEYMVPNKRNAIGTGTVAVHEQSNDATLDISGSLLYNIIWYNDNMMSSDGSTISDGGSSELSSGTDCVWSFEGSDPYALKIKHKDSGKYADGTTTLNSTAQTFMLLSKEGYDYGILQLTGGTNMLSGYGGTLTADSPAKFIIFALSMGGVRYHLVINNIGVKEEIPYRAEAGGTLGTLEVAGSTKRILVTDEHYTTAYVINDVDVTTVSLGDKVSIPSSMYRPNCLFYYYIEGIYTDSDCTIGDDALNNEYKGLPLEDEYLMNDADLLGKYIKINILYRFNTGLDTNAGGDFVRSYTENHWYTFDGKGSGSTVYPAQYTNAWGLKCMEGRASHYTNEYLWAPVGDPYGFVMYNRYMVKNTVNTNSLMTTVALEDGRRLMMATPGAAGVTNPDYGTIEGDEKVVNVSYGNEIYELMESTTDGYFRVHPVANTDVTLFVERNSSDTYAILSTTGSEWTFGLSVEMLKPYFDRKGYVGGLTATAYETLAPDDNSKTLAQAIASGSMTYTQLVATQEMVYDDNNIVPYTAGYYRLHSQPDISSITTPRYASGYLHDIEKTAGAENTAIPMHFYSRKGVTTTFASLDGGYTRTAATQGQIPIAPTESDPSTIFYLAGPGVGEDGFDNSKDSWGFPTSTLQTQGLYACDNGNQRMCMTATEGSATQFSIMDIGGATLLIHDSQIPASRCYMCYDQTVTDSIYDLKFKHDTSTDEAKWCMEPVNNSGLTIAMNSGGDGYYYSTLYVPYDILLPSDQDTAYVCTAWDTEVIYPKAVGEYNTGDYEGNNQYIPAGTPVIIRGVTGTSLNATIPTTSPAASPLTCVFTGQYLEQKLASGNDVYCFGLPFTTTVTKNADYDSTGEITATAPEIATTGVGFYINANLNKEGGPDIADWVPRNNWYVLHNRIYYRSADEPANGAKSYSEYIPTLFGSAQNAKQEDISVMPAKVTIDGCVYDLFGRKVIAAEEMSDNQWRQRLSPGLYIVNGKKVQINGK